MDKNKKGYAQRIFSFSNAAGQRAFLGKPRGSASAWVLLWHWRVWRWRYVFCLNRMKEYFHLILPYPIGLLSTQLSLLHAPELLKQGSSLEILFWNYAHSKKKIQNSQQLQCDEFPFLEFGFIFFFLFRHILEFAQFQFIVWKNKGRRIELWTSKSKNGKRVVFRAFAGKFGVKFEWAEFWVCLQHYNFFAALLVWKRAIWREIARWSQKLVSPVHFLRFSEYLFSFVFFPFVIAHNFHRRPFF